MNPHSENPGLLLLKYREYLQKLYSLDTWFLTEQTNVLRSDTTSNRINRNIIYTIGHSWFIWCPLDISRAFEWTTHMTISSTLKFTDTLPYAWKYHRIDSTERIKKRVLTGSTQQRNTCVQYFRTKTLQVRSDSTENNLNPIQFFIYYNVQFA